MTRQPIHTVYGGAHLFKADTARRLGARALAALDEHGPDAESFAAALGLHVDASQAHTIRDRVVEKLRREPVEDFRIDFEDGYGNRPEREEDGHAASAAREVARGLRDGSLPPYVGIRIKSLSAELARRSVRTLDIFVRTLVADTGALPPNFVVTQPKITHASQVPALVDRLEQAERDAGLPAGALRLELMIETPESVLDPRGACAIPGLVAAARGRGRRPHFGTYDYTASCHITAAHQQMTHPACDFAKHLMQVSLAPTGLWLSDGATNVMPVGDRATVHAAWRLHAEHVRHSLVGGFYQGWDLHPAQLPSRYGAVYAFFLEGLDAASTRLRNFVEKAAQATLVGDVFDDAATGQGLLTYFLRPLNSGAITEQEAVGKSGLTLDELRSRSFVEILKRRRLSPRSG
jgi:citrate lyase beta subunit